MILEKPVRVLVFFSSLAWALTELISNLVVGIQVIFQTAECNHCWNRLLMEDWWCLSDRISFLEIEEN